MDLADLIRTESTHKIKEIIETEGLPKNSKWADYEALNTAIICQRKDIANYLLEKDCRVNKIPQIPDHANTPLHNAVLLRDAELVSELLKRGASTHEANTSSNTPLHIAFIDKQDDIIDLILAAIEKSTNRTNWKNKQGLSHMHIACTRKNLKVVKNFVEAGLDIEDSVNDDSITWAGYTALHFAASFKSHGAIKILLGAGAKTDAVNANQQTPLQLANEDLIESALVVDALSKKEDPHNPEPCVEQISYFHMACLRNDPSTVKKFIEKGMKNQAEISTPIISTSEFFPECTPLHFAVIANQEENVKLLLTNNAYVDHSDSKSKTPLHYALYNKNRNKKSPIIDLLHESINDELADFEDENGLGYFHVAIVRNQLDVVTNFLDNGQDINKPLAEHTPEYPGYYPLHFAVRFQHAKMAASLIERDADVDKVSWDGTPLHIAFELASHRLIQLLWKNDADVTLLRPKDKQTMLHVLVKSYVDQRNNKDTCDRANALLEYIEKLVDKGVDVNGKTTILNDDDGDTALHFACRLLHLGSPCVKMLLDYGADINVKNSQGLLPIINIQSGYLENAADYMMLYHHVQKLKALGLYVDPRNEEWCEVLMKRRKHLDKDAEEFQYKTIKRLEQARLDEIKALESVKLDERTTLYDFLTLDAKSVAVFADNDVLKKMVKDMNLDKNYPSYGYLFMLQCKRAVLAAKAESSMKRTIENNATASGSKRHCPE